MIEHPAKQGTTEWLEARYGIPTASEFKRIVTPTGKASTAWEGYAHELCAEWALGEGHDESLTPMSHWVARGNTLEADARRFIAVVLGVAVRDCGLIFRDQDRKVAASPDGIGEDGNEIIPVELKCPMPKTHLGWLAGEEVPKQHRMQVQGQIWVCQTDIAVFASYCPNLPALVVEVEPIPAIQAALDAAIPDFLTKLDNMKDTLRSKGVQPAADWFSHNMEQST